MNPEDDPEFRCADYTAQAAVLRVRLIDELVGIETFLTPEHQLSVLQNICSDPVFRDVAPAAVIGPESAEQLLRVGEEVPAELLRSIGLALSRGIAPLPYTRGTDVLSADALNGFFAGVSRLANHFRQYEVGLFGWQTEKITNDRFAVMAAAEKERAKQRLRRTAEGARKEPTSREVPAGLRHQDPSAPPGGGQSAWYFRAIAEAGLTAGRPGEVTAEYMQHEVDPSVLGGTDQVEDVAEEEDEEEEFPVNPDEWSQYIRRASVANFIALECCEHVTTAEQALQISRNTPDIQGLIEEILRAEKGEGHELPQHQLLTNQRLLNDDVLIALRRWLFPWVTADVEIEKARFINTCCFLRCRSDHFTWKKVRPYRLSYYHFVVSASSTEVIPVLKDAEAPPIELLATPKGPGSVALQSKHSVKLHNYEARAYSLLRGSYLPTCRRSSIVAVRVQQLNLPPLRVAFVDTDIRATSIQQYGAPGGMRPDAHDTAGNAATYVSGLTTRTIIQQTAGRGTSMTLFKLPGEQITYQSFKNGRALEEAGTMVFLVRGPNFKFPPTTAFAQVATERGAGRIIVIANLNERIAVCFPHQRSKVSFQTFAGMVARRTYSDDAARPLLKGGRSTYHSNIFVCSVAPGALRYERDLTASVLAESKLMGTLPPGDRVSFISCSGLHVDAEGGVHASEEWIERLERVYPPDWIIASAAVHQVPPPLQPREVRFSTDRPAAPGTSVKKRIAAGGQWLLPLKTLWGGGFTPYLIAGCCAQAASISSIPCAFSLDPLMQFVDDARIVVCGRGFGPSIPTSQQGAVDGENMAPPHSRYLCHLSLKWPGYYTDWPMEKMAREEVGYSCVHPHRLQVNPRWRARPVRSGAVVRAGAHFPAWIQAGHHPSEMQRAIVFVLPYIYYSRRLLADHRASVIRTLAAVNHFYVVYEWVPIMTEAAGKLAEVMPIPMSVTVAVGASHQVFSPTRMGAVRHGYAYIITELYAAAPPTLTPLAPVKPPDLPFPDLQMAAQFTARSRIMGSSRHPRSRPLARGEPLTYARNLPQHAWAQDSLNAGHISMVIDLTGALVQHMSAYVRASRLGLKGVLAKPVSRHPIARAVLLDSLGPVTVAGLSDEVAPSCRLNLHRLAGTLTARVAAWQRLLQGWPSGSIPDPLRRATQLATGFIPATPGSELFPGDYYIAASSWASAVTVSGPDPRLVTWLGLVETLAPGFEMGGGVPPDLCLHATVLWPELGTDGILDSQCRAVLLNPTEWIFFRC